MSESQCRCNAIGAGVQTFRLRHPADLFDVVVTLDGILKEMVAARAVWTCRACGQHFAWLRVFYKDHEEIIVRAPTSDWRNWDWEELAAIADSCRWRGPERDKVACRGICEETVVLLSLPGRVFGWRRLQGFAKSAHPWLSYG